MRHKIYFAADAHLGAAHHKDSLEVERRLCRWLDSISEDATAIYFLGDIFDYWFEYKHVVPRGFTRFLGKLAHLSDAGVELHFMVGNHDVWMKDYFEKEIGGKVYHNSITVDLLRKRFRLSHGDAEYKQENFANKLSYYLFRNRICQRLYAAVHPRWTVGLAYYLSYKSRVKGLKDQYHGKIPHALRNDYFEVENELLVRFAKDHSVSHPDVDFYIFGHRHLMLDLALRNKSRVLLLGDWIQYNSFAVWDGENLFLDQFEAD